jgi:hypothetical protein
MDKPANGDSLRIPFSPLCPNAAAQFVRDLDGGSFEVLLREKSEWTGVPPFDAPGWKDWLIWEQAKSN